MSERIDTLTGHPTTAELDRWHTGLLDNEPASRDLVAQHVRDCKRCRERAGVWARIAEELEHGAGDRATVSRIRARRYRALQGIPVQRPRGVRVGMGVFAAITAITIGIGVMFLPAYHSGDDAAVVTTDAGDLYADIDFYLWLLEKQANRNASPRG